MRIRIATALLAASCAAPAPRLAAVTTVPCGPATTQLVATCTGDDDPPPRLGTVDGQDVRLTELPEATRRRAAGIAAEVAEARGKELRRVVDDTLLELEAERRKVSLRDLWESEVLRATPAPTAEARAARETAFARSLEARFPVGALGDAGSAGPPDAVLATVGDRRLTRAAIGWRLDAAAYTTRMDLFFEEYGATDHRIDERLRAAGATGEKQSELRAGHAVEMLVEQPPGPRVFPDLTGAPSRGGGAGAPVTFVEFGDFECPPCGRLWPMVDEALRPYGDRVRYVFAASPMPFHKHAQRAAEAARAAQAQGRFFEYADRLFHNQKALDDAALRRYAAEVGLDAARFENDLDNGRYAADILLERRTAERATGIATPTFLVNGVPLPMTAYNVEGIRAAVDKALAADRR